MGPKRVVVLERDFHAWVKAQSYFMRVCCSHSSTRFLPHFVSVFQSCFTIGLLTHSPFHIVPKIWALVPFASAPAFRRSVTHSFPCSFTFQILPQRLWLVTFLSPIFFTSHSFSFSSSGVSFAYFFEIWPQTVLSSLASLEFTHCMILFSKFRRFSETY